MKCLSNPKSTGYKVCSLISDLVILNFIFIVSCFFVINIAGAVIALYSAIQKLIRKEEGSVFKDYFKAYRENFSVGVKMTFLSVGIILSLSVSLIITLQTEMLIKPLIIGALILAFIVTYIIGCYWFSYTARYQEAFLSSIRTVFQIACLNLKETLMLAAIPILPVYAFTFYNIGFAITMWFFLLVGFSGVGFIVVKNSMNVFGRYEPKTEINY